jgi:hypothetical protein
MCHCIIIGLTDDRDIGKAQATNIDHITKLYNSIRPERRGAEGPQVLAGRDCNATQILAMIERIPVSSVDTLFVYFGGHGAYDKQRAPEGDVSSGHFFQLPNRNLWRADVWRAMANKNARLTILISDTCNVEGSFLPESPFNFRDQTFSARGLSQLETLFLGYRGVVDLNGASLDQYGWCQPDQGSWFTLHIADALTQYNDWNLAFERASKNVEDYFGDKKTWACSDANRLALDRNVRFRLCNPNTVQKPYCFQMQVYRDDDNLLAPSDEPFEVRTPMWDEPAVAVPP